jgi:hypothetical protein
MQEGIRWTNLTYQDIIDHKGAEGFKISKPVVKPQLKRLGYVKRNVKCKSGSVQASIEIVMRNLSASRF